MLTRRYSVNACSGRTLQTELINEAASSLGKVVRRRGWCSLLGLVLMMAAQALARQLDPPASASSAKPPPSASGGQNSSGSGGGTSAEQANNPSEPIPQITLQDSYSGSLDGMGSHGKDQNLALVRFLVPFSKLDPLPLNILRLDVPIVTTPDNTTALGDISGVDVLFVVNKQTFRLGIGPTFTFPTDTYDLAGAGKWELGPAALAIYTGIKGWVIGGLAQNSISFAGRRNSTPIAPVPAMPPEAAMAGSPAAPAPASPPPSSSAATAVTKM